MHYIPQTFRHGNESHHQAVERETRGPKTASGIRLLANKGFMDDLNHLYCESHHTAVDSTGTIIYCPLGTYEIQDQQVQMLGH